MTNAEAMRRMSDAELARQLAEIVDYVVAGVIPEWRLRKGDRIDGSAYILLAWLRQDVREVSER